MYLKDMIRVVIIKLIRTVNDFIILKVTNSKNIIVYGHDFWRALCNSKNIIYQETKLSTSAFFISRPNAAPSGGGTAFPIWKQKTHVI